MIRETSIDEMVSQFDARMRLLARRMRQQFPTVRRWDDTDDIMQESSFRLHRALQRVVPESELHLYRLACMQVRRVLLDLCREHAKQYSFAANHATWDGELPLPDVEDRRGIIENDVAHMEFWTTIHKTAETLPQELRDVFDLLWYAELNQDSAAQILRITKRTLQRRWRATRLLLMRQFPDGFPQ